MNLKNKYIIFCVFLYQIWCLTAFVKVPTLFSFVRISYNQKSRNLLRLVPFIKATLGVVALMTLGWSTQVIRRYATLSFFYVFLPSLTVFLKVWQATVFLKIGLWSFKTKIPVSHVITTNVITWLTGMTYRNIKNEL